MSQEHDILQDNLQAVAGPGAGAYEVLRIGRETKLVFQADRLSQSVIVACSVTGILSTMQTSTVLDCIFEWEHPLSQYKNVKRLFAAVRQQPLKPEQILDRQTIAGCILSFLKAHKLLEPSPQAAAEQNLILQTAGSVVLSHTLQLCLVLDKLLQYAPKNLEGQLTLPRFSLQFKTHQFFSVAKALVSYTKLLRNRLDPEYEDKDRRNFLLGLALETPSEAAKHRIKFVSEFRKDRKKLKEVEAEVKWLLDELSTVLDKPLLSRCRVISRSITFGLSDSAIKTVCEELKKTDHRYSLQLATLFEKAKFGSSFEDALERFSDSVPQAGRKSLQEILADKRALLENKNLLGISEISAPDQEVLAQMEAENEDQIDTETEDEGESDE